MTAPISQDTYTELRAAIQDFVAAHGSRETHLRLTIAMAAQQFGWHIRSTTPY